MIDLNKIYGEMDDRIEDIGIETAEKILAARAEKAFYGHSGQLGHRGGSVAGPKVFDISKYSSNAKEITSEQAMAQASWGDIQAQMKIDLTSNQSGQGKFKDVSGTLDRNTLAAVRDNAHAELGQYVEYLAGDTAHLANGYINKMTDILGDKSMRDMDAQNVDAMMRDSVRKLVYQEIESNRQQFTDHGIRHIVGNIMRADDLMMASADGHAPAMDRLMAAQIMINHDVGYTTPLIRAGGDRGVMMSRQHPAFSEKIYGEQRALWNEGKVFSGDQFDKMTGVVRTHDTTTIDMKDILGTSVRLSDNLSLFASEKLPGMFKFVNGGKKMLTDLGEAAKGKDSYKFREVRDRLHAAIDKAPINEGLKRDLKASTRELSMLSPKFTMGVLAGEISHIGKTAGVLTVDIKHSLWDGFLQKHFDMGQRQVKKLMEDYGHKDFTKTEYMIGSGIKIRVVGVKEAQKEDWGSEDHWDDIYIVK